MLSQYGFTLTFNPMLGATVTTAFRDLLNKLLTNLISQTCYNFNT